ncbi:MULTISPECIES: helix-turn-helix transcriptional regulator [unclassified Streptomyces]|uniref:helix-turn-helix transcriptional regulator n=1 Tax=unclassified Streptomyces TaxID=2593676 RepID=UPI003819D034
MVPAAPTPARVTADRAVALPILKSGPGVRPARDPRTRHPADRPRQSERFVHGRPFHVGPRTTAVGPRTAAETGQKRFRTSRGTEGGSPPAGERVWRLVWSIGTAQPPRSAGPADADHRPLLPAGAVALVPPHRMDWIEAASAAGTLGEVAFCWPGTPPEQAQPWVRLPRSPDPSPVLLDYLLWLGKARTGRWQEMAAQSLWMVLSLLLEGGAQAGPSGAEPVDEPALRTPAGSLPGRPPVLTVRASDSVPGDAEEHATDLAKAGLARARPELAAALGYVREAWSLGPRPLTLAELAGAASVSRGHFARMFQAHFGIGAVTALEQVRLARAESLLLAGDLNVSQVARACGFADPLHFSRRFRATHGLAPQVFRKDPLAAAQRCDGPAVQTLLRLVGL